MHPANSINTETARAATAFLGKLRERHPLAEAWLFGSRARGDNHPESDADVAVILPELRGSRLAETGALADLAFDVLLETGLLVSPLPVSRQEFDDPSLANNPDLIHNILREGVPL